MKKVIKGISLVCLAFLMVCPLMLVGCAKKYTIDISVNNKAFGDVYKVNVSTSQTLIGKNTVEEGKKFEYFVSAHDGYEIESIVIDGVPYANSYDKQGTRLYFADVKGDHTVEVTFKAIQRVVTFYCENATGDGFVEYKVINVDNGAVLDLAEQVVVENTYWYIMSGANKKYLNNGVENDYEADLAEGHAVNKIIVNADMNIYVDQNLNA